MSEEEAKVSRKGEYEMMFGVILPIMCLLLDPIVFRSRLPGLPMLGVIWLSGYFFVVTQIILFVVWLWFGHRIKVMSVWFAGFFFVGGCASLGIGVMLSPVAFFTLMFLVGALGFVPFGTSYVFFRQCYIAFKQAQEHAQRGVLVMLFVLGVIMAAAPPAYQYTLHQTQFSKAFALLVVDDEAKRKEAVQILRRHVYWADLDQMVVMYRDATSQRVKERLWRAYFDITGKDLTARLNAMFD